MVPALSSAGGRAGSIPHLFIFIVCEILCFVIASPVVHLLNYCRFSRMSVTLISSALIVVTFNLFVDTVNYGREMKQQRISG